ncbi:hydroxyacylglutathione hydrolase [Streptosporangium becharense]|uniref:Hydroxyacylglutathione hydrolase n=1 Tax=Streptosporangium becharense TaxID=1816182 RepID=A0A7W9MHJ9_9ACTN|nr:MBL fold metallo-hydrolase [Streptosporangium becharense]MBB2913527.1 hydroxyacylglutathione hydrolase [Streptosporangium becharense]MBB5821217.1 hydroxyacylglutathione hydrolase [Streptosporangium becharense]
MTARIERVVTEGVVDIDGVEHEVENNTWILGDDEEVIVIDPARDAERIMEKVGKREVLAVICTHGLPDHVGAAIEIALRDEAVVALHPKDRPLWRQTWPETWPDIDMEDEGVFAVADVELEVMSTPGVTHGGVSLYCESLDAVFTGKTLQADGPGKIGEEYPALADQLTAIGGRLFTLRHSTRVLPAHGEETTIGALEPHFDAWLSGSLTRGPGEQEAASESPLTDGTRAAGIRLNARDE